MILQGLIAGLAAVAGGITFYWRRLIGFFRGAKPDQAPRGQSGKSEGSDQA
jgi:hypothetical protein